MTAPDAPPTLESVLRKAQSTGFTPEFRAALARKQQVAVLALGAPVLVAADGRLVVGAEQIATEIGLRGMDCPTCCGSGDAGRFGLGEDICEFCGGHGSLFALPEKDHPTPPR